MRAEQFIPLPEAVYNSRRVRFNLPFPSWVETEQIGVNLKKTEQLMNLGGISHLRVGGSWDEDVTKIMPTGVGIAPDGSRYAGFMAAKEKVDPDSSESQKDEGKGWFLKNSEWRSLAITLNLKEIQHRIEANNGNLRKSSSWTPFIDRALREHTRNAGTRHLLWQRKPLEIFMTLMANETIFENSIDAVRNHLLGKDYGFSLTLMAWDIGLIWLIWGTVGRHIAGREADGHGYRTSLIQGFEIDRAAMLQVLSRTTKLVKPLDSTK